MTEPVTDAFGDWEARVAAVWQIADSLTPEELVRTIDALAGERAREDPFALFERACARDTAGLEDAAEPLYRAALASGELDPYRHARASIQLASTLRHLGLLEESEQLLRIQLERCAAAGSGAALHDEVRAVLAFTWLAQGKSVAAAALALETLAPHLTRYNRSMAANARSIAEADALAARPVSCSHGDMERAAQLFDWLVDGAPGAHSAAAVIERVGTSLCAAGVAVDRIGVFVRTLHPTILGRSFYWEPDKPVQVFHMTAAFEHDATVAHSPVATVTTTKRELRRRLTEPLDPGEFVVLHELRERGYADFVCLPMQFQRDETHAITFTTKRPEGFSDRDLAVLRDVTRPLTLVAEIFALHRTAANLLTTYVGHNSGERILAGRIFKGDIETIRAIIWFSDLRGFTQMSARLEPRAIIDTLNELFECQVPQIEAHGGEVLKFIGDGLLAIFPFDDDGAAARATARALTAADAAFAALAARNARAAEPIQFGLALHLGEFAYGNIGGSSRLDFTAIGPAVNIAARLEGLTGKLGHPLVVSAAFAAHTDRALDLLGEFELKGVPTGQAVFAPRPPRVS